MTVASQDDSEGASWYIYLHIENAEGNVLIAVYLYACVCVIRISQKVLNLLA